MLQKVITRKLRDTPGGLEFVARGLWLPMMQRVARSLPAAQLHVYCQVLSGSLPTAEALAGWGYQIDQRCPLCRRCRDTQWHRAWECDHPSVVQVRSQHFGEDFLEQVHRADQNSFLLSRLWVPYPDLPSPVEDWMLFFFGSDGTPVDEFQFEAEDDLYTDGSCLQPETEEIARAGISVVQMRGDQLVRGVYSPLPAQFLQAASDAEHGALAVACLRRKNPTPEQVPKPISVDCASLFLGTRDPPRALSGASRLSFFW
eukprot:3530662-Pyramimonas_sp.AAC.1